MGYACVGGGHDSVAQPCRCTSREFVQMRRWSLDPRLGAILQLTVDQGHWRTLQDGVDGGLTQTLPDPRTVWALVDTGAAITCVRGDLAESLGLVHAGDVRIVNVGAHLDQGARERWTSKRHMRLTIEGVGAFEVQAAEVSRFVDIGDVDIEVLLGRDILSQCVLKIDGPAGAFSLHR